MKAKIILFADLIIIINYNLITTDNDRTIVEMLVEQTFEYVLWWTKWQLLTYSGERP